ncbi:hypothetical protein BTR14_14540 [Rhizobium rhizosphaerae]|uniref:Toxin-antitoxin system HicB family antitoxin n=1 Tax=Xaviernesmea rhizosphaerae TaxID=1672749 RepID=A0ABX3PCF2_9HYPH|nr:hypothetical protein [Xaviernesmea rhizosphaerae]OQP85682.1 hypothetical protein BTR14_14540 [Xaviernesmea rhizosphaerae]
MVGRPPGPDRTAFALRVDPTVMDLVKHCAAAELRSVNAQIEVLLREALAARGLRKAAPGGD